MNAWLSRVRPVFSIALLTLFIAACGQEPPSSEAHTCEGAACDDAGDLPSPEEPEEPELICSDRCPLGGNGSCDDGGPGASSNGCELGTDCRDCGPRDPTVICTPDCTGRICGLDGCGGSCGEGCSEGQSCTDAGQCEVGLRDWSGATANLRLVLGDTTGPEFGRKVCIYGRENDNPYLVLHARAHAPGDVLVVNADYVDVPAGVSGLRISHHLTTGEHDDSPRGCDASQATRLSWNIPRAGDFYTLVVRTYDDASTAPCAANAAEQSCDFFSTLDTSLPEVPCAGQEPALLHDYDVVERAGGVRIANFTTNASVLMGSFSGESAKSYSNHYAELSLGRYYESPVESPHIRICPAYLHCDPRLSWREHRDATNGCWLEGDAAWMLAETTYERFAIEN